MAPSITATGPQIDTLPQVVSDILNGTSTVQGFYQIYGPSIQVGSNSPDGNIINIFALSKIDMENFGVGIYQAMDPDEAVGIALDNDAQYCGITRKAGTYTLVSIAVVVSQSLNLNGLDLVYGAQPYTIQDGNGNQYNLIASIAVTTGTYNLNFQAANIGAVQAAANTITTPVTILAGVTSVNNPAVPYQVGTNQETDANFRMRRQASTSFPAQGELDGLYAGLNDSPNIIGANVYENNTGSPVNGIPANGIWAVVNGGTAAAIAQILYNRRSAGTPMKGSQTYNITQANGVIVTMKWDNVVLQTLYVTAFLQSIPGQSINTTAIAAYLVANWNFLINQPADIATMIGLIAQAQEGVVASAAGVSSDNVNFYNVLAPSSQQNQWQLLAANITLNLYP
ncbi:unnamed protein product [Sphagnum balticum]